MIATGNAVGDSVLNLCDSGYVLDGLIVRLCEDDGRWSGEEPRCVSKYLSDSRLSNVLVVSVYLASRKLAHYQSLLLGAFSLISSY